MQPESERSTLTSSSSKRIAICYSGLVRTYRQTHQNHVDCLIGCNPQHQFETFISTWPIERSNVSMVQTRCGHELAEDPIDLNDLRLKYSPVTMLVENPIDFDDSWFTPIKDTNMKSLLSMTYKIRSCDLLRRHREAMCGFKYDAVIRVRFDAMFPFELKFDDQYDFGKLLVPLMMQPRPFEEYEWVNDKFAVGDGDIMAKYSDWYLNFRSMIDNGVPAQPETLLAKHLQDSGVAYSTWGCEMDLIR